MHVFFAKVWSGIKGLILYCKPFCLWLPIENRLRFAVLADRVGYRSAQPNKKQLEYLIKKYSIHNLIVIRTHVEDYEEEIVRRYGMSLVHIPFCGHRPPDESMVKMFLNTVQNFQYQPFLIHCWYGKDRTGVFSLLYRIEILGWGLKNAWEEMMSFGHAPFFRKSPYKEWLQERYREVL